MPPRPLDAGKSDIVRVCLRQCREKVGLSQEGLIELTGDLVPLVSLDTYQRVESGKRTPTYRTIRLVADALKKANSEVDLLAEIDAASENPLTLPEISEVPAAEDSFVGRLEELYKTTDALKFSRLVTIVGPGGIGKTRLSIEVARTLRSDERTILWLDFTNMASPDSMNAASLSQRICSKIKRLRNRVCETEILLILDNCERVVGYCTDLVERLLRETQSLRILATSRCRLGVTSEGVTRLRPLPRQDALQLLRARTYGLKALWDASGDLNWRSKFADPSHHLRSICKSLDGVPLAIELAACWLQNMSPEDLSIRIEAYLLRLSAPGRQRPEHHQSVEAMIAWSYDQLEQSEQALFARLAVFPGDWTLAAAEAICSDRLDSQVGGAVPEEGPGISLTGSEHQRRPIGEVAPLLVALVEKSLVVFSNGRYGYLIPTRSFAVSKLSAREGENYWLESAHARFYFGLTGNWQKLWGESQETCMLELMSEDSNLRAALTFILRKPGHRAAERSLRMAMNLDRYWDLRGAPETAFEWHRRALDRRAEINPELAASDMVTTLIEGLVWGGWKAMWSRDVTTAQTWEDEALKLTRVVEHRFSEKMGEWRRLRATALNISGMIALTETNTPLARRCFLSALEVNQTNNDVIAVTYNYSGLGDVCNLEGEYAAAVEYYRRAQAINKEQKQFFNVANNLLSEGKAAVRAGWYEDADTSLVDALKYAERPEVYSLRPVIKSTLAHVLAAKCDFGRANQYFREAVLQYAETANHPDTINSLYGWAAMLADAGDFSRAGVLVGAAIGALEYDDEKIPDYFDPRVLQQIRGEAGEAYLRGSTMSFIEVCDATAQWGDDLRPLDSNNGGRKLSPS